MADIMSTDGFIRNGLPGKPMRMAMECKNLLQSAGSVYYGTGRPITITITGENGQGEEYIIYETKAAVPPSASGTFVLKCINGVVQWVAE